MGVEAELLEGEARGDGLGLSGLGVMRAKPCSWMGRSCWVLSFGERYICAISVAAVLPVFFTWKVSSTVSSVVCASLAACRFW